MNVTAFRSAIAALCLLGLTPARAVDLSATDRGVRVSIPLSAAGRKVVELGVGDDINVTAIGATRTLATWFPLLAPLMSPNFTGLVTANGGLAVSPGSAGTAGAVGKLSLFGPLNGSAYGFGVSPASLDYAVPDTAAHSFYVAGVRFAYVSQAGLVASNITSAGGINHSTALVAAAGTTQATATALSAGINAVTSGAGGVRVAGVIGQRQEIFNRLGAAISVYPPSGAQIEAGAANAAVSIASGGHGVFVGLTASQIYQAP